MSQLLLLLLYITIQCFDVFSFLHLNQISKTVNLFKSLSYPYCKAAKSSSSILHKLSAESVGFSESFFESGFHLQTQCIFGSNAIEHGVNLLEEKFSRILVISGWNCARLDSILWELEPRGFQLNFINIPYEPTTDDVKSIIDACIKYQPEAVIAMGCGSVIDAGKLATTLLNLHYRDVTEFKNLPNMTSVDLQQILLSNRKLLIDSKFKSVTGSKKLLFVTIPLLPVNGAEISGFSALRMLPSKPLESSPFRNQALTNTLSKIYIHTATPSLCLIQPSVSNNAPMVMIHGRIVSLIATAIDMIMGDAGYLPELLAYDALKQLMKIADVAIEVLISMSHIYYSLQTVGFLIIDIIL